MLWSPHNTWLQAWNRAENLSGVVPLVVPLGDLEDIKDIGEDEALTYDEGGLSNMLSRYQSGEAVLAIAIPDQDLALLRNDTEQAIGALAIHIYRTDRAGPEYMQQIIATAVQGQTKGQLLDEAVKKVHKALQRNWKRNTLVDASDSNYLQVRVDFKSLEEWAETQKALEQVYGINEIVLRSLSPKSARVDLIFQGTEQRLRMALQQANITLSEPRISMAGFYQEIDNPAMPLVYELYLNRYAPVSPYGGRF